MRPAGQGKSAHGKDDSLLPLQPDWGEVTDEVDVLAGISSLTNMPSQDRCRDFEVLRRIEMLREERLLQQALGDIYDA